MAGLPLNALLAQALITVTHEYDGSAPSLPVWANVLRPIGDGIEVRDLPAAARLSKRATKAAAAAAEKRGWVQGGNRALKLSVLGAAARDAWPALDEKANARFADLAAPAAALVRQLYLEWPHYPAGYGPADDSATGGIYTAGGGQIDSRIPTHADDWSPVLRDDRDGSSVAGVPVYALLSQALMAFTADFEELWIGGLHNAATILQWLPDDGAPIKNFPALANLPGNGKSILERHLYIEIVRDRKVKLAVPTARGRNTRDNYLATVGRVEERWGPKYGDDVVTALRTALENADVDRSLPHHVIGILDTRA